MNITRNKLTLTVDKELVIQARVKCLQEGTNISKIVRSVLRLWIDGKLKIS